MSKQLITLPDLIALDKAHDALMRATVDLVRASTAGRMSKVLELRARVDACAQRWDSTMERLRERLLGDLQ